MSLVTVNEENCKKDGICAAECPVSIIGWEKDSYPIAVEGAETLCISCGHCVSVCPHKALSHRDMVPEDCLEFEQNLILSEKQTEHFLRARRSIRNFKDKVVDQDTLSRIIGIAAHAPSGHNSQPVQWQVISGREKINTYTRIVINWMEQVLEKTPQLGKSMHMDMIVAAWRMGVDVVTRNAPNLILVNGAVNNPTAADASKIAMTYFDIAAQSFGVGTCWCGYFSWAATVSDELKKALELDGLTCHGAMMAGYPKFKYLRMPTRNEPKIKWVS